MSEAALRFTNSVLAGYRRWPDHDRMELHRTRRLADRVSNIVTHLAYPQTLSFSMLLYVDLAIYVDFNSREVELILAIDRLETVA